MASIPDPTAFFDAAFAALAHPGRRAILHLLREAGPLRAAQIAAEFPAVTPRAIRRHLRCLCAAGLVIARPGQRRNDAERTITTAAFCGAMPHGNHVWYDINAPLTVPLSAELLDLQGCAGGYTTTKT